MSKEAEERRLYVGLDETNHGRYPEIIVAVSSLIKSDAKPLQMKGRERLNVEELIRFLANEQRGFRYLAAKKGEIERTRHQLVVAAPYLVEHMIREMQRKLGRIDCLEILLDGDIKSGDIDELQDNLLDIKTMKKIRIANIEHYPKSEKVAYDYPKLLVATDSLAHYLFRKHSFIEKIGAEQRRVSFG